MENHILIQENKKLKKFLDISLYLGSTLDLKELLERVNNAFKEVLGTEDSSIFLYDEENEELDFYQVTNLADERVLKKIILRKGEGIAGAVALNRESIIVNNVSHDPRHDKRADQSTGKVTRNLIAVPLVYQDRFIGVMEGMNKIEGDFNEDDLKLALSFGNIASVALENAKLHEETESNLKKIKELEAVKTEFVSVISHELKTPLTPILGYIDMITSRIDVIKKEDIKEFLSMVKGKASHLHMLINDLFIANEVDKLQTNLFLKEMDVCEVIKESMKFWKKKNYTHPVNFEPPADKLKVALDRARLGHCIYHILENAAKFSEEGTPIDVRLGLIKKDGIDTIEIVVKDGGIGIPEEYYEKIFDRFFQISAGTTREYEGLGIGLFICRKIIEAHRGRIFCKSEEGRGSKFYIHMPV